jgi:hypothetical protein
VLIFPDHLNVFLNFGRKVTEPSIEREADELPKIPRMQYPFAHEEFEKAPKNEKSQKIF